MTTSHGHCCFSTSLVEGMLYNSLPVCSMSCADVKSTPIAFRSIPMEYSKLHLDPIWQWKIFWDCTWKIPTAKTKRIGKNSMKTVQPSTAMYLWTLETPFPPIQKSERLPFARMFSPTRQTKQTRTGFLGEVATFVSWEGVGPRVS